MISILKSTNSKKLILCVELLEICSKNCDLNFHRYIGTKQYAQVFLKLLERWRGKGFVHKFYTNEMKKRWDKIENLLLYLIQLWADTFIMKEDENPGF